MSVWIRYSWWGFSHTSDMESAIYYFFRQHLWLSRHNDSYVKYLNQEVYEVLGDSLISEASKIVQDCTTFACRNIYREYV